jgi:DNA-binding beta-propeller fold protein YncE
MDAFRTNSAQEPRLVARTAARSATGSPAAIGLTHIGYIALPEHLGGGGFDHAAVHAATGHVYVAHTANGSVDVLDPGTMTHLFSIPDLPGAAGVLMNDERQLVIVANRGENTIALFEPGPDPHVTKVAVGMRPNGLACDPIRGQVLVANVGDPADPTSPTLSVVELDGRTVLAEIGVPGRTRWAVHDPEAGGFFVNIADPPQIAFLASREPRRIARTFPIPEAGPHGLDLDRAGRRLFCACDAKSLVALNANSGEVLGRQALSGVPDVVFFNPALRHLYVAIGDPGVIDVFDTATMEWVGCVPTETGAHTLAFDPARGRVLAFLPETHRALVYRAAAC